MKTFQAYEIWKFFAYLAEIILFSPMNSMYEEILVPIFVKFGILQDKYSICLL